MSARHLAHCRATAQSARQAEEEEREDEGGKKGLFGSFFKGCVRVRSRCCRLVNPTHRRHLIKSTDVQSKMLPCVARTQQRACAGIVPGGVCGGHRGAVGASWAHLYTGDLTGTFKMD